MRRLAPRSTLHDERGATAVMIALLLTTLFGMAAFAIDAAALYQERRELQNGADAGALAVAWDCVKGDCGDTLGTADSLADANADDNAHNIDAVDVDMSAQTATVDTSTNEDGSSSMTLRFAGVLGITDATVHASATAKWGVVGRAPTIPLTIHECEWNAATGGSPDNLPSAVVNLVFHDGNAGTTSGCEEGSGSSGSDLPGGFGWLDSDACEATVDVTDGSVWVGSDPGAQPPKDCDPFDHFPLDEPLTVPIFDDTSGQGTKGQFHVVGFAAIKLTGFRLLQGNPAWTQGVFDCITDAVDDGLNPGSPGSAVSADASCVTGTFVDYYPADAWVSDTAADFGVETVQLIK